MGKTYGVLLIVCFLMSLTAAILSAGNENSKEIAIKK
jgi:hypothetical protein